MKKFYGVKKFFILCPRVKEFAPKNFCSLDLKSEKRIFFDKDAFFLELKQRISRRKNKKTLNISIWH